MNQEDNRVQDEGLHVGPWAIYAHIEMRSQQRGIDPSAREPRLKGGDVWFRVVVQIDAADFDELDGLGGELTTSWHDSIRSAAKQAKRLRGMLLNWSEYDNETDAYVERIGSFQSAEFDRLIDEAVERFRLTTQQALGL